MCSLVDGALPVEEASKATVDLTKAVCQKCREAKAVLCLRRKDVYCRQCFITACLHKFRSTLGKHKVMRPRDHALISFLGDTSSLSLLHLNSAGLDDSNKKKLQFTTSVIIVDDSGAFGSPSEERIRRIGEIVAMAKGFEVFPVYVVALEVALKADVGSEEVFRVWKEEERTYELPATSLTTQLRTLFTQTNDGSALDSLLSHLRARALTQAAGVLGVDKVFTSETTTDLAVSVLSGIAMGRGLHVPLDAGFQDFRYPSTPLLRPMREFSSEELTLYHQHESLPPPVAQLSFTSTSIHRLTEGFVLGLQEDFPATVPTVFKMGDKFQMNEDHSECLKEPGSSCLLCGGLIDTALSASDPSAVEATAFSQQISLQGSTQLKEEMLTADALKNWTIDDASTDHNPCDNPKAASNCSGEGLCSDGGGCNSSKPKAGPSKLDILRHLCYACRLVVRSASAMPPFLEDSVAKAMRREKVKEEIQDFLL